MLNGEFLFYMLIEILKIRNILKINEKVISGDLKTFIAEKVCRKAGFKIDEING